MSRYRVGAYDVRVSPRIPLGAIPLGALALLAGCGEPPQPMPTAAPPYVSPSAAPISLFPSYPVIVPTGPAYPTNNPAYPTYPAGTATTIPTAGTTKSPTPTPSHATKCSGSPTRAQVITLIKGYDGIPDKPLSVSDGPYCSGTWSFSMVEVTGESADQLEPLMVVATGKDASMALVAAGSDVCVDRVQNEAPPGIRVLACGF
jgi:hypothetical protein